MMKRLLTCAACLMLFAAAGCAGKPATHDLDTPEKAAVETTADAHKAVLKTLNANIAPAEVFSAVAAQYKGSVAFIDLWATWCPPCRRAMAEVDKIKPALQQKGCKFVYLTGETSPLDDFNAMYKTIEGDHFRLTDAQFKGVMEKFEVSGIPHYVLIDRQGNILWQHTGYPGNDEVQSQIEVALAK